MLAMPIPAEPSLRGRVLDGKYALAAIIGSGRVGIVYRALHVALQKPVAVKVLHAGDRIAAHDFAQFRVEAEALGRLNHPRIAGVTDFGVDPQGGGTPYLVMELVEGETLEVLLAREGPVDLVRAAPWIADIAAALDHARQEGVAHGDLSPNNVVLVPGDHGVVAKVIDFGLARLVRDDADPAGFAGETPDLHRLIAGTPAYMAPERLRGAPPSHEADVYALSALAYRMIAGRPPFDGDLRAMVHERLTRAAAPLSVAGVPPALDDLLQRGMSVRVSDRPRGAGALAAGVAEVAGHVARARWRRREAPRRLALAVAVAMALTAGGPWLSQAGLVQRLEGATQDARVAVSPARAPDPRMLLVSIDEASLAGDPRPLAGRADEFAAGIVKVLESGAAVIALDLLLPETWASSRAFADLVLTHTPRLVLGAATEGSTVVGPEALDPLVVAGLGRSAASGLFALVTFTPAPDGVVRQARAAIRDVDGRSRPTLAGRVWELTAARGAARAAADDYFLLDYRVDVSRFDRMPWHQVAGGGGGSLSDRVVVLGAEFMASGDRHRAPAPGRLARDLSGLTLQGIAIDTLLQERPLRPLPGRVVWIGVAAMLTATVLALLWMTRLRTAWIASAGSLSIGVAVALAAFASGRVAPMAAPAVMWMTAAGIGLACRLRLPAPPAARVRSHR